MVKNLMAKMALKAPLVQNGYSVRKLTVPS